MNVMDKEKAKLKFGKKTYIMGILNVTPDSFSDGGDFFNMETAVHHAEEMVQQGADIIDIGGESTRPGYQVVETAEEIKRVVPIIRKLKSSYLTVPISLDTYKAAVAEEGLKNGVDMINDIWGLQKDMDMATVVAHYDVPIIIMHNQDGTIYSEDIILSMIHFFHRSIDIAMKAGISQENIILDPGIGFGKTPEQNMLVMRRIDELKVMGFPILLGTSRKSMIGKILDVSPKDRVEGTVATTVMGIIQGVDIIRVHDVKENYRAARVTDAIYRGFQHG
ncbi:MAG: dihydropteroate synthase [Eubacteriales bacterium]